MIIIDRLCYCSKLRYVNAVEKSAFTVLTLAACILSRSCAVALFVLAATGVLTVYKGGLPLFRYLKLMSMPAAFLLLGTAAIFINISKVPLGAFAFSAGSYYITGSFQGLRQGAELILTALAGISCLYFLSLSTPVTDILTVLKRLHVPALILELMLLIYRYIFVMLKLAEDITVSQHARLGNRNLAASRKSFAAMVSSIFILSIRRSGQLYDALESRCYNGTLRVLPEDHPAKASEVFSIAVFELFLYLAVIFLKLSGGTP